MSYVVGSMVQLRLPTNSRISEPDAGDGSFSLGMIADYMDSLVTYGAAFYRNLFWEAGLVGQVLYLEAEEASIRSTGIGCYFDDPVHEVFGICSRDWQSFYHFTVGGPASRTNGSRPYQRTSWRMNHEPPDIRLSKSDRTAARTNSKGARGTER